MTNLDVGNASLQSMQQQRMQGEDEVGHPYFRMARKIYFKAVRKADGETIRSYAIAGRTARLNFASSRLVAVLTPALEHLMTTGDDAPDLDIFIWDSVSTGTGLPAPQLGSHLLPLGRVPGLNTERLHTVFDVTSSLLYMFDADEKQAIFWVKDPRRLPDGINGLPLRPIFHWWLAHMGCQILHAAAVGTETGDGVLIIGKGGTGKSTTVMSCIEGGLLCAGDDRIIIGPDLLRPSACSLYNSLRLYPEQVVRNWPNYLDSVRNPKRPNQEKTLFFLHQMRPAKCVPRFRIRALLLPHIAMQRNTSLKFISAPQALLKITPNAMFPQRMPTASEFRKLCDFIRNTPKFSLSLGTDLNTIPETIRDLLKGKGI